MLQGRMTRRLGPVHVLVVLHSFKGLLVDALGPVANGTFDFVGPVDGDDGDEAEGDELAALAGFTGLIVAVGAVVAFGLVAFPGVAEVLGWVRKRKSERRELLSGLQQLELRQDLSGAMV